MTTFQILLKDRQMKQSLEMWVSGRYRLNYIKRPVVEKEEDNSPERQEELAAALEELKLEFEQLMVHTHKCTECDWTGTEEQCETEGICPNCAAHTEEI